MKKLTTTAALSVATLAALSLAGCGAKPATVESISAKVISEMEKVTSKKENLYLNFEGEISIPEYNMDVDMTMEFDLDAEYTADPNVTFMEGEMNISALGEKESAEVQAYLELDDNKLITYSSEDGGDSWTKSTEKLKDDEIEQYTQLYRKKIFEDMQSGDIEATLREETEEEQKEECYVIDAVITGEYAVELVDASGLDMGDVLDEIDEDDLEDVDTDFTIYISTESSLPVKITADMTNLGSALMAASMGEADMDGYEINIEEFVLEQTVKSYNDVEEIEIPKKALKAEEGEEDNGISTGSSLFGGSSSEGAEEGSVTSTPTPTPEATETPAADPTTTPASAPVAGSVDWTDLKFTLDGKEYQIPVAYQDLVAAGWSFDIADYGYEGGYVTNPGDKQYGTISVENAAYPHVYFYIGTVNLSQGVQDITENSLWSIDIDIESADIYPEMTLAGGITWGATLEEVYAAYGTPEDEPYYSDTFGYYTVDYSNDFNEYMTLTVYEDGGVKKISLKNYGL